MFNSCSFISFKRKFENTLVYLYWRFLFDNKLEIVKTNSYYSNFWVEVYNQFLENQVLKRFKSFLEFYKVDEPIEEYFTFGKVYWIIQKIYNFYIKQRQK